MKQYEYTWRYFDIRKNGNVCGTMDEWGAEGWMVVSMFERENGNVLSIYLMREKPRD